MSFFNFLMTILFICLLGLAIIHFVSVDDFEVTKEVVTDFTYCKIYETCNKVNFDPLSKNLSFCGVIINEDKLKEDCLT